MDVVDTWADVAWVGFVNEDLEQFRITLTVLDGQNVGVQRRDGMEEILELGVAEVRVDLGRVRDTSGGEAESLDGVGEVVLTLAALSKWETLTKGGLIDLDDVDACGFEVNDLVTQSKSELLSLLGLVDIVTWEGPSEAGDGTCEHTLHGSFGNTHGILGFLDGHWGGARDITDHDRRADTAGAVALNPRELGEGITGQALAEVLHHVVSLGLTVNQDVEVELILDVDAVVDFLFDEFFVLLWRYLTLGEFISLDTDVFGLRERADAGGGEERELELLLLLSDTSSERRLAIVLVLSNFGLTFFDLRVIGTARACTGLCGFSIGLQLGLDAGRALVDSLAEDCNFFRLFYGEAEPIIDFGIEFLFALKSMRSVEERAGS